MPVELIGEIFVPTVRKALIITMSSYCKPFSTLNSPPTNGKKINTFLSTQCDFKDIVHIQEESDKSPIDEGLASLQNSAKDIGNGKLLLFVYYSGTGP